MKKITVTLETHEYDILIGENFLKKTGSILKKQFPHSRFFLITDQNIASFYLTSISDSFSHEDIKLEYSIIPPGDVSKSWKSLESITNKILELNFDRYDVIIALGGGVVGDLSGLAASLVKRGLFFVQIPTSLLAQVDSAIGGKTGINTFYGKNLIGTFYQPNLVLSDITLLKTLPLREFKSGYAEIVKYALINNKNFFDWLEKNWREVFKTQSTQQEAIEISCLSKRDLVCEDEKEHDRRALLNLGHTFGHAFEALCQYDTNILAHGEAVSIGLAYAHKFSLFLNLITEAEVRRVINHLQTVGLPTNLDAIPTAQNSTKSILAYMKRDKKVKNNKLRMILSHGIGKSFVSDAISDRVLIDFLSSNLAKNRNV